MGAFLMLLQANLKKRKEQQSMKVSIEKVTASELSECLEVIHQSFRTVAEEFGLTQENCPKHTSFMPLYYLETHMEQECEWCNMLKIGYPTITP